MARSEPGDEDLAARIRIPALLLLLGCVTRQGLVVNGLLAMNAFWGPSGRQVMGAIVADLLIVGAIWSLSRLKPSRLQIAALALLLGFAALLGFGAVSAVVKSLIANNWLGLWYWKTLCLMAANLLVCAGAIWGFLRLRPWKALQGSDEPVSPGTRRTNKLLGLSGLVAILGVLVLIYHTNSKDNPLGLFSNSPVSLGIAIFAISCWLLSMVINKWYWYFSADEHERRADDVGNLAGWALFMVATPAWWVAARAGLLPQPNAMFLWVVATGISAVGYFWRRNRSSASLASI